ncbi:pepsin/retropepsin-like aspartic protease family protein [Pseudopedobacter sp.]|uniref:pepsin/retropepsin-like aspartic protease family protein n=1 Tax=Pseudopedobacter sp. TaxID=1936787 RepID=UPI00333E3F5B
MKLFYLGVLLFVSLNVVGQHPDSEFEKIYHLIKQKAFFKAKESYCINKNKLSILHQTIVEAFIDNSFNALKHSNNKISYIMKSKHMLSDSLCLALYKIKEDNSVKLFNYKEAKNTLDTIFTGYNNILTDDERKELDNNLKIWSALDRELAQQINIYESDTLEMIKDKAGLDNLAITTIGKDTIHFVFDTGANLSTITESVGKKMHIKTIPVDIEVGTITGENVLAQLGVCPSFMLGNIEIQNAVFLVLKDSDLTFEQIDYQINGVLGFPIIEGLREVKITDDGHFIIVNQGMEIMQYSNMVLDGLTPLISIEGRSYSLDTGASQTILYHAYYAEKQSEIDKLYKATKLTFAGAGGTKEFEGYIIDPVFNTFNKKIKLKDVQLLKSKINDKETLYGNIGQDFMKQFSSMTLNFDQMFVKFD